MIRKDLIFLIITILFIITSIIGFIIGINFAMTISMLIIIGILTISKIKNPKFNLWLEKNIFPSANNNYAIRYSSEYGDIEC